MEKEQSWDTESVISQLSEGMELTSKLKKHLHNDASNSRDACGFLVEKIVSCYDNALSLLSCMNVLENGDSMTLIEGSPKSEVSDLDLKDHVFAAHMNKKRINRKNLPRWSEEVRACPGAGFDIQLDDGYNWRKYGQKDILGAAHPRAYYRCTYRYTQGCLATKQVQRREDDSSIFKVAYRGKHSCVLKQTKENVSVERNDEENQRLTQDMMINIESASPKVESQELNSETVETHFLSEPTTELYFSMPHSHSNYIRTDHSFLPSESYLPDIISNSTPTPIFPNGDSDFLIDQVDFDSCFFEAPDYFDH